MSKAKSKPAKKKKRASWPLDPMSPFNGPGAVLSYVLDGPPLSEAERKLMYWTMRGPASRKP